MRRQAMQLVVCVAAVVGICATVMADVSYFLFQGSLEAKVTFAKVVDGPDEFLEVTLENISASDVVEPTDVLTAVFFDLAGDPTLTPVRALLTGGSVVHFPDVLPDGIDSNGEVGGEYAYKAGLGINGPADRTISAVGQGDVIGPSDLFPGEPLWGPPSDAPDGLGYGITSAGDDLNVGNAKVTGGVPLVQNGVVFRLSGLPDAYNVDGSVSNVWFNYGTGLLAFPGFPGVGEPRIIPVPAALWGGMMLFGGILASSRIRRRIR